MLIAGTAISQQTWKVFHGGGPGVDFTDLPPAVAAAAPGDRILVYRDNLSLNYNYTPAIIDKPLSIAGFLTGFSPGHSSPSRVSVRGLFLITGIEAGEQVTLSNLVVSQQNSQPAGVVAWDCEGDIVLEDWFVAGNQNLNHRMHFQNCANVVIRGCEIYMGGSPLTFDNSNALISWSLVGYDSPGGTWPLYSYPATTDTVHLVDSKAAFVASSVHAIGIVNGSIPEYYAERGVRVEDSELLVGPFSRFYGGVIFDPLTAPPWRWDGYYLVGNSAVTLDPRAVVDQIPQGPPLSMEYMDAVYHTDLVAAESYSVVVTGEPGGFAVLASGDYHPLPTPSPLGTLALDPCTIAVSGIVPLPAPGGWHEFDLVCPATAAVAHAFAFQAATLAPDGTFALSIPSPCTVGWPHGVLP